MVAEKIIFSSQLFLLISTIISWENIPIDYSFVIVLLSLSDCMILSGKELSLSLKQDLIAKRAQIFGDTPVYVAIIFLGDDYSSATYVKHKKAYGDAINVPVIVFGQNHAQRGISYDRNQAGKFDDAYFSLCHRGTGLLDFLDDYGISGYE